jgi:hypothetical protein
VSNILKDCVFTGFTNFNLVFTLKLCKTLKIFLYFSSQKKKKLVFVIVEKQKMAYVIQALPDGDLSVVFLCGIILKY